MVSTLPKIPMCSLAPAKGLNGRPFGRKCLVHRLGSQNAGEPAPCLSRRDAIVSVLAASVVSILPLPVAAASFDQIQVHLEEVVEQLSHGASNRHL